MIPSPRPSPEPLTRVVPVGATHRGTLCVLIRDHAGSCVPAPGHVVRREIAA
jgi:hypothetical protein